MPPVLAEALQHSLTLSVRHDPGERGVLPQVHRLGIWRRQGQQDRVDTVLKQGVPPVGAREQEQLIKAIAGRDADLAAAIITHSTRQALVTLEHAWVRSPAEDDTGDDDIAGAAT